METVAIIGAGGKMGRRCLANLEGSPRYQLRLCEKAPAAAQALDEAGHTVYPLEEAVRDTDFVVTAVPDTHLAALAEILVPLLRRGATLVMLDPAVPCSGGIPIREGLNYVVTHPCHPPLFLDQPTPEARRDYFGGVAAIQDIVIAFMEGNRTVMPAAEQLCRNLFAPVRDCHEVTVDQMAILEPALSEIVGAGCALLMKEAIDVAAAKGVPRAAAQAFMLGHIQIAQAIVFGAVPSPFSDAAKVAASLAKEWVFREDWKQVFEHEKVQEAIERMLHPQPQAR